MVLTTVSLLCFTRGRSGRCNVSYESFMTLVTVVKVLVVLTYIRSGSAVIRASKRAQKRGSLIGKLARG